MRILEFEQTRVPGIEDVARRVNLSPFHFARLFARQMGEGCAAYSRRIRLDGANNQMMHDRVPLGIVATTFGYDSQAAFNRAYERQFGMSPRRYLAKVLGRTPAGHAAAHLDPVAPAPCDTLLAADPLLVERPARLALARRFFGTDIADHWRRFRADLPQGLCDGARFAGMSYDNARVTPDAFWRYDCALVPADPRTPLPRIDPAYGLDPVEIPGGLHAEIAREGGIADLWRTTIGLFTEWLPRHPDYRPEGDPVVHWLGIPVDADSFAFTATIRIYRSNEQPAYNLRPLTRYGAPAGHRTPLAED